MLVYGWKLVDYPEKLGPEGQFYSPIIWESVNSIKSFLIFEIELNLVLLQCITTSISMY